MHDDVAKLARAERLVEAAELARGHGDLRTASELFERACEWGRAAEVALLAGEPTRALTLAATAGAAWARVAEAALEALKAGESPSELRGLAQGLRQQGEHAWGARVLEAAGAMEEAAEAWERAGEWVRAARLLEATADGHGAVRAARVLEAALRREPDRPDLLLAFGALLARAGKAAAALRTLQRVPDASLEKREALHVSLVALADLGMVDARAEVLAQLAALGEAPGAAARVADALPRAALVATARLYGRYEVVREVSSNATARLLECQDTLRGERVAVKIFSAHAPATRGSGRDALTHFAREARVLAQLAHPNIVPMRDVLEQSGAPALVLAWMPGGTLEELLARETLTPARAVDIACAVLRALGEAHRLGVVHRDLKPANILFDAAGTACLSDFGVAHLSDLSATATAGVFGSLAYMSPEQREGRPATAQSDIFGAGAVLLEMLTGRRPGTLVSGGELVLATFHRYLDTRHDAALASLLARDPSLRPPDAFTAVRLLEALPWPAEHDLEREASPLPRRTSVHPPQERLSASPSPVARDLWLERDVVRVPLTEATLARAGVFARVGHRALQTVLRVDREGGAIWLGIPKGAALTRALLPSERIVLESALGLLHAQGLVHGAVATNAIVVGEDGPVLLFPAGACESEDAEVDRAALARL